MVPPRVYNHLSTKNTSFVLMHNYLKDIGIKNNAFMLRLYDPGLADVNPFDPKLDFTMKMRVARECMNNYWYYLREVVRIKDTGADGEGTRYKLHRGNLAMNFCKQLNLCTYVEMPRQFYKTFSAAINFLYDFQFGCSNTEMYFLNITEEKAKKNLRDLKRCRDALPSYLQFSQAFKVNGKRKVPMNNAKSLTNVFNDNRIFVTPKAVSRSSAMNLLRGKSSPLIWYDEHAFIAYNDEIYTNAVPAYLKSAQIAREHGKPYGIVITTTAGDMQTEEGRQSYDMRNKAIDFSEKWYDMSSDEIYKMIDQNSESIMVHIKYMYYQLTSDPNWIIEARKAMGGRYADFCREYLLQWNAVNPKSPFRREDLEIIGKIVEKVPDNTVMLRDSLLMHMYYDPKKDKSINKYVRLEKYPPLIGVDVSGGVGTDSHVITVVDSRTTKLMAIFKNNNINSVVLAKVLEEIVLKYFPNAIVNVENNGGFGSSLIHILLERNKISKNLYYEFKEKPLEVQVNQNGRLKTSSVKKKVKVYGSTSTKHTRDFLIDILRQRVEQHKDKFYSKFLYDEILSLERNEANGKVAAAVGAHDDCVMSYLWAMYLWYEGKNLQNWGFSKTSITTDQEVVEESIDDDIAKDNSNSLTMMKLADTNDTKSELANEELAQQMALIAKASQSISYEQWLSQQQNDDHSALLRILNTNDGRKLYAEEHNLKPVEVDGLRAALSQTVVKDTSNMDYIFSQYTKDEWDEMNHKKSKNQVLNHLEEYQGFDDTHLLH